MRAAKVQASLRIRAVSPEPPLLTHTSSESRGTFRQKTRSLAPLNGWACAVKICHDGMLEDTNSLDAAQSVQKLRTITVVLKEIRVVQYAIVFVTSLCLNQLVRTVRLYLCPNKWPHLREDNLWFPDVVHGSKHMGQH